jgi:hypothetical protein
MQSGRGGLDPKRNGLSTGWLVGANRLVVVSVRRAFASVCANIRSCLCYRQTSTQFNPTRPDLNPRLQRQAYKGTIDQMRAELAKVKK